MSGLAKLVVATVVAGALLAALIMPPFLGAGLLSNKITRAVAEVPQIDFSDPMPARTTITDSAGKVLTTIYRQDRIPLKSLDEISLYLQGAVVSIEDRRFSAHKGVDWSGTIRGLLRNAEGGDLQGGSTLTQQYIKNYLLYVKAKTAAERAAATEITPIRKLREAKLAMQLEQQSSKDDVLLGYLNLVAFGPSTYGAEATARRYFNVSAADLSLPQAALMAAMINNPNKFNPLRADRLDDAIARRNLVLDAMVRNRAITRVQAEQAKKAPAGLQVNPTPNGCLDSPGAGTNGYYCQYVLDFLRRHGFDDAKMGAGGYTIKTNLSETAMKAAKAAVDANVDPRAAPRIANVLALVEPGTSTRKVVALVANRPYGLDAKAGQTVQRLTTTFAPLGAGSTFKVFTAAAAMELGIGTGYSMAVPPTYYSPLAPSHAFRNYSRNLPARMTLTQALAQSPNTPFVALEDQIGLDKVADMAVRLGLRSYQLDAGEVSPQFAGAGQSYAQEVVRQKIASFTLGVSPVSPLELANVGATLASDGMWCPPSPIDTITDRNGNLQQLTGMEECNQAVPANLARTLSVAMEHDVTEGTAKATVAASKWGLHRIAGKTGTTQDFKSASFLGFTAQFAGAAMMWDYLPRPQSICRVATSARSCTGAHALAGNGMTGGVAPAKTWVDAMLPLHTGQPPQPLGPESAEYISGKPSNQVPDVRGKDVTEATAEIEKAGFKVTTRISNDSGAAQNIVVDQNPIGAALPNTSVNLVISAGTGN